MFALLWSPPKFKPANSTPYKFAPRKLAETSVNFLLDSYDNGLKNLTVSPPLFIIFSSAASLFVIGGIVPSLPITSLKLAPLYEQFKNVAPRISAPLNQRLINYIHQKHIF